MVRFPDMLERLAGECPSGFWRRGGGRSSAIQVARPGFCGYGPGMTFSPPRLGPCDETWDFRDERDDRRKAQDPGEERICLGSRTDVMGCTHSPICHWTLFHIVWPEAPEVRVSSGSKPVTAIDYRS